MRAVPLTPEQLAEVAAHAAAIVDAIDALGSKPRPLTRELGPADREFIRGLRDIEREVHNAPHSAEERIDRLRQLAIAQRREPETIGQLIARKGWTRRAPEPEAPKQLEQHHGDAAE